MTNIANEIHHEFTNTVICPKCGEDHGCDEWEDSGRYECQECGFEFRYDADYDVTYSTHCVVHDYPEEWQDRRDGVGKFRYCKVCGHCDLAATRDS